ncbi:hypothetical protein, partial [Escherichia coli]|uniref:hypothetical protein n=1 Tax=Escherichia coli TaxID=562 RepID=UPI0019668485
DEGDDALQLHEEPTGEAGEMALNENDCNSCFVTQMSRWSKNMRPKGSHSEPVRPFPFVSAVRAVSSARAATFGQPLQDSASFC